MTLYSKTITTKLNSLQPIKGVDGDVGVVTKANCTTGKKLRRKTMNRKKNTISTNGRIRLNDLLMKPLVFPQKNNSQECTRTIPDVPKIVLSMEDSLHAMVQKQQEQRDINSTTRTEEPSEALKTKRVHFAPLATVATIPPCIAKEDVMKRWYSAKDYKQFEQDRTLAVDAVRWAIGNGIYFNDTDDGITLGLEHHIAINALYERKYKIYQHSYYVLKQQQYLKTSTGSILVDSYDDQCETLRFVSELFSRGRIIVPQDQQQQGHYQEQGLQNSCIMMNNMDRIASWNGRNSSSNVVASIHHTNCNEGIMMNASPNNIIMEGQSAATSNNSEVSKLNPFDEGTLFSID